MRILTDIHTHTIYSRHAYSTIEECVRSAAEAGLELYGAADHYSDLLFPPRDGGPHLRDYQFFLNLKLWPRTWHGVQVLRGCEADIVDLDGHLFGHDVPVLRGITGDLLRKPTTLKDIVFGNCDYVVASIHGKDFAREATTQQVTEMYVRVLDDPKVLALGHIGRSGLPIDVDTVVLAARDRHKLIELNEHSFNYGSSTVERCRHIARRCMELGCSVVVNTDAHIATDIGRFPRTEALLDELAFPEELVANRNAASFVEALAAAGMPLKL